jgi:hypothetical protein
MAKSETRLVVEQKWKEQSVRECAAWAQATVPALTPARLADYEAGLRRGWDTCIRTLKMHGLLELRD